jgi:hypothetical protein
MSNIEEVNDKDVIRKILKAKEEDVKTNLEVIQNCLKKIREGELISIEARSLLETIVILCEDSSFKIDDAAAIRTASEIDGKNLLKIVRMKKKDPDFFDIYK